MTVKLPPVLLNIDQFAGVYAEDSRIKRYKNNYLFTPPPPPNFQKDRKGTRKRDYNWSGEAVSFHGFFVLYDRKLPPVSRVVFLLLRAIVDGNMNQPYLEVYDAA